MKASQVIQILTKAIPQEIEWSVGEPYGPFGVDTESDVQKILYCVTPTPEVVKYFKKHKYDLIISHHPFVVGVPQIILHTSLDCCSGGLNDSWRDALGIQDAKHFDSSLGWAGKIPPIKFQDLVKKCGIFVGQDVIGQVHSDLDVIESVVVCSGLGGMVTDLARETGAQCYVLGEATESVKKMGFKAVIEIGHTLSERMGVNLIRDLLPGIQVCGAPLNIDVFGKETYLGKRRKA